MLNNILKLDGAQKLNKNEQQKVTGGHGIGLGESRCPTNPRLCFYHGMCGPCHL